MYSEAAWDGMVLVQCNIRKKSSFLICIKSLDSGINFQEGVSPSLSLVQK